MRVWVLVKKDRLKMKQAKRFAEEAQKMGIKLRQVCAEDFEIVEPSSDPKKIWMKGRYVKLPDVLIPRITGVNYFTHALIRLFQHLGVIVMNSSASIEAAEDKLLTTQLLTAKKLPIPKSILAKFPLDCDYVADQLGFPIILKTVLGAKGEGVLKFDNKSQFEDVVHILQSSTGGKTYLIAQECVTSSLGRDIRVVVMGGKPIGAVMRIGAEGDFKANVSAGGRAEFFPLNDEICDLAIQATEALGLTISGVDFLMDKEGYKIAEVNSTPSFDGFELAAELNIYQLALEEAKRRFEERDAV